MTFTAWIRVLRPLQWAKNLACFAPLVFANKLTQAAAVALSLRAFTVFCLVSSAVYILNDVLDRDRDRRSPRKRFRPIAAGQIRPLPALILAFILVAGAAGLSVSLPHRFQWMVAAYLVLMVAYSLILKRFAILDVLAIAVGFVLRIQAGIEVLGAPQSAWILECAFSLALVLGFAKRRGELQVEPVGPEHRPALAQYNAEFLDRAVLLSASLTLVSYALYAVLVQRTAAFMLTFLPVFYGVCRYVLLVTRAEGTESPELILFRDVPLIASVVVWVGLCAAFLYAPATS